MPRSCGEYFLYGFKDARSAPDAAGLRRLRGTLPLAFLHD